jgi:LPXTG-motif cell wall-anchored protein
LHGTDIHGDSAELPVTLFDTTTDSSGLSTDRLHVFFDFSTPGTIQVVELFIISNPTGKLVVPPAAGKPVITFDLPDTAANLQFDSGALGDRYLKTATGFGDTAPVEPGSGQHQVLFSFEEPYDGKLALSVPIKMNTTAAVVMVPVGGVNLKSDQLQSAGTRDVQGTSYQLFAGNSLNAGSTLQINLSGSVHGGTPATGTNSNLVIGLGVFGAALIGAAIWLLRQRRLREPALEVAEEPVGTKESVDSLLDAILALDDLHQSGTLPDEAYRIRRAELKERVRRALDAGGG